MVRSVGTICHVTITQSPALRACPYFCELICALICAPFCAPPLRLLHANSATQKGDETTRKMSELSDFQYALLNGYVAETGTSDIPIFQ